MFFLESLAASLIANLSLPGLLAQVQIGCKGLTLAITQVLAAILSVGGYVCKTSSALDVINEKQSTKLIRFDAKEIPGQNRHKNLSNALTKFFASKLQSCHGIKLLSIGAEVRVFKIRSINIFLQFRQDHDNFSELLIRKLESQTSTSILKQTYISKLTVGNGMRSSIRLIE